jgi:hypothetical protein
MTQTNFETLETDDPHLKVLFDFVKERRANPKPVDYSEYPEEEREYWRREFENKGKHGLAEKSSFRVVGLNRAQNSEGVEVGFRSWGSLYLKGKRGQVSFIASSGGIVNNHYYWCVFIEGSPYWERADGSARRHLTKRELREVMRLIADAHLASEVKTYFQFDDGTEIWT